MSHPTWVRGLKLGGVFSTVQEDRSHPTWVRGLKRWCLATDHFAVRVAPYVGAWIET